MRPRGAAVLLASLGADAGSGAGVQEGHRCHARHGPGLPRSLLGSGTTCAGEGPRPVTPRTPAGKEAASGSLPRSHSLGPEERR